jgi:hypothetical protein
MEVDEFLAALSTSAESPQVGVAVIGSDRGKIGEVEEVVTPDGEKPGHLRVPRGVILEYRSHAPTGLRS